MKRPDAPVAVVGAGLAGLACAVALHEAGVPVHVYEKSDGVGGRVRTDHVDGFTLDRGFQVLLTAYPEAHRQLDLEALDLRPFEPGALVWRDGRGWVVADPFRRPADLVSSVRAPVGSLLDKARIARLRMRLRRTDPAALLRGADVTERQALADDGFSDEMVERFFRPLLGGILLDRELGDSRRIAEVIVRMLADGDSAVPAAGMQAIPDQLAARLPASAVHCGVAATGAYPSAVTLDDGSRLDAAAVVVATEGPAAADLLDLPARPSKAAAAVYFAAPEPPVDRRLVVLDGTGAGPVLNAAVMSNVAPSYAPPGSHLVVAALPGRADDAVEADARSQLRGWWGPVVDTWQHVATYRIAHGQPSQRPPFHPKQSVQLPDGRFVCGDHRDTASIQGALYSGRRCAAAVRAVIGKT